eukprot:scaffold117108_cov17-Prasinocladus_malaysianus.AAC.1
MSMIVLSVAIANLWPDRLMKRKSTVVYFGFHYVHCTSAVPLIPFQATCLVYAVCNPQWNFESVVRQP